MPFIAGTKEHLESSGSWIEFVDAQFDDVNAEGVSIESSVFECIRMKNAKFSGCSLRFSEFHDVYLRYAEFRRVDLTGVLFRECNLRHAVFEQCKLWYTRFQNCEMDYEGVLASAPNEELYVRERLIHNLRMNAVSVGDVRSANRLLLLEMKADRMEKWMIFMSATEYHRSKFTTLDRINAFGDWIRHWIESLLWGYGVRLLSLLCAATVVVVVAAVLLYFTEGSFYVPEVIDKSSTDLSRKLSLLECAYFSTVAFSTLGLGDFAPQSAGARLISAFLSVVDYRPLMNGRTVMERSGTSRAVGHGDGSVGCW